MSNERFWPIKIVREKLIEKKQLCGNSADELTLKRLDYLERMLNNERCFFELYRGTAIEILSFLGFKEEEIFDLYDKLTDYEIFKGDFSFTVEDENIK